MPVSFSFQTDRITINDAGNSSGMSLYDNYSYSCPGTIIHQKKISIKHCNSNNLN